MLVLTRNIGQTIVFGKKGEVRITVLGVRGNQVRLGIEAPKEIEINREEIFLRLLAEKQKENAA